MQKEQQMAAVETSTGGGGCAGIEQVLGTGVPVCGRVSLRIRMQFNTLGSSFQSFQNSSGILGKGLNFGLSGIIFRMLVGAELHLKYKSIPRSSFRQLSVISEKLLVKASTNMQR